MKTKILTSVLALIFSSTIAFTQSKTKSDEKRSSSTKTEITKDSVYYSCSMHPDVKMDKPGKCSKCGMFGNTSGFHKCKGKMRMADIKEFEV